MIDFSNIKNPLRISLAIFLAILLGHFFAMSEKFWIPLSALIVMQTPIGSTVFHGLQRFIVLMLFVILGSIILLQAELIYPRVCDVAFGTLIGMVFNLVFFPERPDVEFRFRVIPILNAYSNYLSSIGDVMLRLPDAEKIAREKRKEVELQLLNQFPRWVYESGLAITLRQGHRHFLVMVDKIGMLLFSMHREASHRLDADMRSSLALPLKNNIEMVQKMIATIVAILSLDRPKAMPEDVIPEDNSLEKIFQKCIPPSIELLELSKDYMSFGAFLSDLRDLKLSLLKLLEALR
jgi:hypothetical protein